jgi:branched-chain amino acid transport system substrate-binding protein
MTPHTGRSGRRPHFHRVLLAILATALVTSACGGGDEPQGSSEASGEPIRIGLLVGLTGSYATLGENERASAEIYVAQLNKDGGIDGRDVELVVADTTSNESEAVNQLRRLVTQEKVVAVLGPSSSGESIAVKPLAESLHVPLLSLASSPEIIRDSEWAFKAFPGTLESLKAQLEYVQAQGMTRVALLASNNAYGQEPAGILKDLASDYDVTIVGQEMFPPDATDMTSQLSALAENAPEATLVWAVNPANAVIAKNAGAMDYPGILFNSPGGASNQYIELAGESAEGTFAQGSKIAVVDDVAKDDKQYAEIQAFVEAWKTDGDGPINQFAAIGWDAMAIMKAALTGADLGGTAEEDRQAVRESLETNVSSLPLTNTVFDFSPEQHGPSSTTGLAILQVKDGKFTLVK